MDCPRCKTELRTTEPGEHGLVVLDVCPDCDGAWFDKGELDRLDESVWTNVETVERVLAVASRDPMRCPRCRVEMVPVSPRDAPDLVVDRCPSCQGFWLDRGELDRAREVAGAADSRLSERVVYTQRPPGWSLLRWLAYCVRGAYSRGGA